MIALAAFYLRSRGLPDSPYKRCHYTAVVRSLLVFLAVGVAIVPASTPSQAGAIEKGRDSTTRGAESGDKQVHIGTFRTKPSSERRGAPAVETGAPTKTLRANQRSKKKPAKALLANARKHLGAKRLAIAQRRFEQVIARYPNSVEANAARGHLARLYTPGRDNAPPKTASVRKKPVATATRTTVTDRGNRDRSAPNELGAAPVLPINTALSRALGLAVGDRVFFAPGSDKLGLRARAVLQRQAHWLNRRSRLTVLVSGHADEPGGSSHNLELSKRRAQTVKDRLIEEGIAENRVKIQALGRDKPIAQCGERICAAQNRRVVTSIVKGAVLRVRVKRAPAQGDRKEVLPWE